MSTIAQHIGLIFIVGAALAAAGCGNTSLEFDQQLDVVMYGAFIAPADATGNAEPRSITFELSSVSLVNADDTLTTFDLSALTTTSFRISSYSQKILSQDLADYDGQTFSGIEITFAPAITAVGKYEAALASTLATPTIRHTEEFTVETAKSKRLEVKVEWKNTITRDEEVDPPTETISAPTFSFSFGDS